VGYKFGFARALALGVLRGGDGAGLDTGARGIRRAETRFAPKESDLAARFTQSPR